MKARTLRATLIFAIAGAISVFPLACSTEGGTSSGSKKDAGSSATTDTGADTGDTGTPDTTDTGTSDTGPADTTTDTGDTGDTGADTTDTTGTTDTGADTTDTTDTGDTGACVPQCDFKMCGPDTCGGTCPPGCVDGEVCTDGTCLDEGGTGDTGGDTGLDGACTNEADQKIVDDLDVETIAKDCALANLGNEPAAVACIKDKTGLSDPCIVCFSGIVTCGILKCAGDCLIDSSSPACNKCLEDTPDDMRFIEQERRRNGHLLEPDRPPEREVDRPDQKRAKLEAALVQQPEARDDLQLGIAEQGDLQAVALTMGPALLGGVLAQRDDRHAVLVHQRTHRVESP